MAENTSVIQLLDLSGLFSLAVAYISAAIIATLTIQIVNCLARTEGAKATWDYQHSTILLRFKNIRTVKKSIKTIRSKRIFVGSRYILKHNYNFRIGKLKQ